MSSYICNVCSLQFENIFKFKQNLINTQNILLNLLEESSETLSTRGDDVKLEAFEPKTTIKTELDPEMIIASNNTVLNLEDPTVFVPSKPHIKQKTKRKHRTSDEYPE